MSDRRTLLRQVGAVLTSVTMLASMFGCTGSPGTDGVLLMAPVMIPALIVSPIVSPVANVFRFVSEKLMTEYEKGLRCEGAKAYERAIEHYTNILERRGHDNPLSELVRFRMARCYEQLHKNPEAQDRDYLTKATGIYKKLLEASSEVLRHSSLYRLECGIHLSPDIVIPSHGVSPSDGRTIDKRQEELQRTVEIYEGFAQRHPDNMYAGSTLYSAGMLYEEMGHPTKPMETYISILQHHPDAIMISSRSLGIYTSKLDRARPLAPFIYGRMQKMVGGWRHCLPEDDPQAWAKWWAVNEIRFAASLQDDYTREDSRRGAIRRKH